MLGSSLRKPLTLVAMAGMLAVPLPMSDPVGIYAVIERVVLVPNAQNPTAVQLWGTFAVSEQKPGDIYQPAVKGYLYYSVNESNARASRSEWADLQGLAGKKVFVGFGAKWQRGVLGRVRCATEAPSEPDVYPLGLGVIKMSEGRNTGWVTQKDVLSGSAPDAPCRKSK